MNRLGVNTGKALAIGLTLTLALLWALTTSTGTPTAQAATTSSPVYVDADATGAATGLSWTAAYTDLQDALDAATYGNEIWVAEGVYTPTNITGRNATFELVGGVALYGGFAATETLRTQRDWNTHVTVLSGDLDGNDLVDAHGVVTDTARIVGNNAYHVVSSGSNVTETAVLDGFAITGGYADTWPNTAGGGMLNNGGSPMLLNAIFSGNLASDDGGGMWSDDDCSPTLINVTFNHNSARFGAGMYNYDDSDATLINVTFTGNAATQDGGGMENDWSHVTLINVSFSGNTADYGGGMYNFSGVVDLINVTVSDNQASSKGGGMVNDDSSVTVQNSIIWNNMASTDPQMWNYSSSPGVTYSLVQGGCPTQATCSNLLVTDPQFIHNPNPGDGDWTTLSDNDYGDLRLGFGSPAIDAGDNTVVPADTIDLDDDGDTAEQVPLDLADTPRFVDMPFKADTGSGTAPLVDMGAYETQLPDFSVCLPLVLRN